MFHIILMALQSFPCFWCTYLWLWSVRICGCWSSWNKKPSWQICHILKECSKFLERWKILLGKEIVGYSSDLKNVAIQPHLCVWSCTVLHILTFPCTSFRSASLDVEPIYTFRAHTWVFAGKLCCILRFF